MDRHKSSSLNHTRLLSHSSVGQKSRWAQLVSLFLVSQDQNQGASRAVFLPRGSGDESVSTLISCCLIVPCSHRTETSVSLLSVCRRSSLASRGHPHSMTHDPLPHLQSQQWPVSHLESLSPPHLIHLSNSCQRNFCFLRAQVMRLCPPGDLPILRPITIMTLQSPFIAVPSFVFD